MTTFAFLVGCADCSDVSRTFADHDRRQQVMDSHPTAHTTAHFVAATEHPAAEPGDAPVFVPGDEVTFHGSTTDQAADHQPATVITAMRGVDQDGQPVDGYLITVPVQQPSGDAVTYHVFVPAGALAAA